MSQKRKRNFATWADAETAYSALSAVSGAQEIALRSVVNGSVIWLEGEQPRKIGLCQLDRQHCGVVILVERLIIGALYLDEWLRRVETQPEPYPKKSWMMEQRAWVDTRQLAAKAKTLRDQAQDKAAATASGCQRGGPAQEVDQNVRTY